MKRERLRSNVSGGGNYFTAPKTKLKFIPTGSKMLDLAMGGGWCRGRVGNVVGDKSTGKTLLCIEASANFIRKVPKGIVRYRESESAFDKGYAGALGMPLDKVDFGEPMETVEDLFEDLESVVDKATGPELYICDSLDALSDRDEMSRDVDKGSYGAAKAKMMSQLFRRLVRKIEDKDITVIIVSQVRDNIGAMFGRKTKRSGGKALDFYATHVLYLAHLKQLNRTVKNVKRTVGVEILAKVDKNKVSLPFREAQFPILFGFGIDDLSACLGFLKEVGALKEVGVAPNAIKDYVRETMRADDETYRERLAVIHKAVEAQWYDMENKLIPTRKKYG